MTNSLAHASADGERWNRRGMAALAGVPPASLIEALWRDLDASRLRVLEQELLSRSTDAFEADALDALAIHEARLATVRRTLIWREQGAEAAFRHLAAERQAAFAEAYRCFERAAAVGDAEGMWNLGWRYHLGEGIAADQGQAVAWWRRAAVAGHRPSRDHLAAIAGRT